MERNVFTGMSVPSGFFQCFKSESQSTQVARAGSHIARSSSTVMKRMSQKNMLYNI